MGMIEELHPYVKENYQTQRLIMFNVFTNTRGTVVG